MVDIYDPIQGGGKASPRPQDVSSISKDDISPSVGDPKEKFGSWEREVPEIRIYKDSYNGYIPIMPSMVHSLQIFESLENICLIGELVIRDVFSVTEKLSINGNEIIEVVIRSVSSKAPKIIQFEVFQMFTRNRAGASGKMNDVVISLVQYPLWGNLLKRKIAKGYKNKLVSEIIKDLTLNYLKPNQENISNTQGRMESFVIPYWDLATTIKYLEKIALNSDKKGAFFCWTNIHSIFNFRSLHELYEQDIKHKFWIKEVDTSGSEDNMILSYEVDKIHKEFFKGGLAGGTFAGFDWEQGLYLEVGLDFSGASENAIGSHYLYNTNIDSDNGIYQYEGWNDRLFLQAANDTTVSSAINSQLEGYVLVNGILEITTGNKIEIQLSDKKLDTEALTRSKEMEGFWLIKSVHHKWTNDLPYRQKYILIRDSYFNINDPELKIATSTLMTGS